MLDESGLEGAGDISSSCAIIGAAEAEWVKMRVYREKKNRLGKRSVVPMLRRAGPKKTGVQEKAKLIRKVLILAEWISAYSQALLDQTRPRFRASIPGGLCHWPALQNARPFRDVHGLGAMRTPWGREKEEGPTTQTQPNTVRSFHWSER